MRFATQREWLKSSLERPSEKSRRASRCSLRTRRNGSKKLYFSAECHLNRGATDYSRPFSDGLYTEF
jgi:hypothetical protein